MALVISGHTCTDAGVNRATLLHHCLGRYPWRPSPAFARAVLRRGGTLERGMARSCGLRSGVAAPQPIFLPSNRNQGFPLGV